MIRYRIQECTLVRSLLLALQQDQELQLFFSGETDESNTIPQSSSDCCYLTTSGEAGNVKRLGDWTQLKNFQIYANECEVSRGAAEYSGRLYVFL